MCADFPPFRLAKNVFIRLLSLVAQPMSTKSLTSKTCETSIIGYLEPKIHSRDFKHKDQKEAACKPPSHGETVSDEDDRQEKNIFSTPAETSDPYV